MDTPKVIKMSIGFGDSVKEITGFITNGAIKVPITKDVIETVVAVNPPLAYLDCGNGNSRPVYLHTLCKVLI